MEQDIAVKQEIYTEGEYLSKHPDWHTADAGWKAANILKLISRNRLHPKNICEIGCGAGEILNVMHGSMDAGTRFVGYEISPQAIALARSREKERLSFRLAALEEIDKSQPYDLAMLIDVFEHVDDFYGFLRKAGAVSQQMIFHIPLDISVQSVFRGYPLLRKRRNSGHIHYFTKDTALASLEDTGYKVLDHFYTGSTTERPSRTLLSAIWKWPRKLLFAISPDFTVRLLGGYSLMVLADCPSKVSS